MVFADPVLLEMMIAKAAEELLVLVPILAN